MDVIPKEFFEKNSVGSMQELQGLALVILAGAWSSRGSCNWGCR